ncbi:MAG: YlcI/YnfO family protein [Gemmatimonadales bacterium]|nr:YlcI/YnfO family protein [Gemmatimonadales bacterium]
MSAMSLRLPLSLHEAAKELAEREGVSVNQLVATALAEKLSALMTVEHLLARGERGTRRKFLAAMARVPDIEPPPEDRRSERKGAFKRSQPAKPRPKARGRAQTK